MVSDPFYIRDKVQRAGPVTVTLRLPGGWRVGKPWEVETRDLLVQIRELPRGEWHFSYRLRRKGRLLRRAHFQVRATGTVDLGPELFGDVKGGDVVMLGASRPERGRGKPAGNGRGRAATGVDGESG